jgi:SpoVK/Ycf46/Vps4 family AAA+-type ATPase
VILWIDEIDKGFAGIHSSSFSDSGTTARVFGTVVTWMQEKEASVFVIATANNVESLPPEVLRKGRFDEIFFVDLPSAEERCEIFTIHIGLRNRDASQFDLQKLSAATEGFSGAEIEQALISALYDAYEKKSDITTENILEAIKDTYPLSQTMKEEIEERRRWADGRARSAS